MSTFPDLYPKANQKHLGVLKGTCDLSPSGITVHYTADRDLGRTVRALAARDLAYHLVVDRTGEVFQLVSLRAGVWHAGKALWGAQSPNRAHLAVSLLSWGEVDRIAPGAFLSWNGRMVPTAEVEERRGDWWDVATEPQEDALIDLLVWCCRQGIDPDNICGHDECAVPKGRKIDPGGVLSLTMEELRARVRGSLTAATV